jgi:hypothetical protein
MTTRRVRVTASRPGPRTFEPAPASREIDEQTELGAAYMSSLVGAQLRLALRVLGATLGALAMLPTLFVVAPGVRTHQVAGVPLPWLLLGILVYPAVWLAGRRYVRQAERHEAAFSDLVTRP